MSSKDRSTFLSIQLWTERSTVGPVHPMSGSSLPPSFDPKMCSLLRGSAAWHFVVGIRHSVHPQMGVLQKALCAGRQFCVRMTVHASEDKESFPWWEWSSIICVPPGCKLLTPANGATSGTQCWFLLLAPWAFSSFGEGESVLRSPCITSIPASRAICSWAHWAMTVVAEERGDRCLQNGSCCPLDC